MLPAMPATDALIEAAWTAYREARPADGIAAAEQAVAADAGHGGAWYALACNLERAGRLADSDRAFARAARAATAPEPAPFRVSWARFQRSVRAAGDALPRDLRAALGEVTLVLADYAEPYLLAEYTDPELLGMLEGPTRAERDHGGEVSPRIHLWRRAHEHAAVDAASFDEEVQQTLHHELGHYLGIDEAGLADLGMD
jgi:predicted Zn-dependent protease with MMP-like domain